MKLAFCLFNYFPFGGLQRDFLRIANACVQAGHEVHVYTQSWAGEKSPGLSLHIHPGKGWTNHGKAKNFAKKVQKLIATEAFDRVIGFNKMPGLDFYYAADVCYQARVMDTRSTWARWTGRYRTWLKLERAVFGVGEKTKILLISPPQKLVYQTCYQTEDARFYLLPPGISKDRQPPADVEALREKVRRSNAIPHGHIVLLFIASSFKTKGLDRMVQALAALPPALKAKTHLWVIGQDDSKPYQQLALTLGIHSKMRFFGARHDIPRFLWSADLLVHPARHENTGTVLLEALVAGLPVLTVEACGYAPYIQESGAGQVVASPFDQTTWNHALVTMMNDIKNPVWRERALAFSSSADIYDMPHTAAQIITQPEPQA